MQVTCTTPTGQHKDGRGLFRTRTDKTFRTAVGITGIRR
jgi:hypothetical protein